MFEIDPCTGMMLVPSYHGEDCPGSGDLPEFECCCDECEHYLACFPDWKELTDLNCNKKEGDRVQMNPIKVIFSSVRDLRDWLKKKNYESGSPEKYIEWLQGFFEEGNSVFVRYEEYDYWACLELL